METRDEERRRKWREEGREKLGERERRGDWEGEERVGFFIQFLWGE